ncbi:MAG TPA: tetratricopeptide repeat protein [Candidatus Acidoferrales bacterium]|nr:tetratricopeptide repeat protein [Candidatus Acidoferrales bacterium]
MSFVVLYNRDHQLERGIAHSRKVAVLRAIVAWFLSSASLLFLPMLASAQGSTGPRTPPSNAMDPNSIGSAAPGNGSATLMIYLRDEYGVSPVSAPIFSVHSLTFNSTNPPPPRPFEGGWVLSGLQPRDEYDIEVSISGYKVAHKFVVVPDSPIGSSSPMTTTVFIYLTSEGSSDDGLAPSSGVVLAPRAEKEVQHALKDIQSNNFSSAQKHASKALEMAPGNPYVNYLLGMCYLRMNKLPEAKTNLEKSVSLDPKQAPPLQALGMLRYREGDYAGASQILEQAVQLDPNAWRAEWMLASSYVHQEDYQKARVAAEKAIKAGKENAAPVQLLLGEALAGVGEREKAIAAFEEYLKRYPKDPSNGQIRSWISDLSKPPAQTLPGAAPVAETAPSDARPSVELNNLLPAKLPLPTAELPPKENWAPPDVDSVHPPVARSSGCPLPKIMQEAGKSALDLVTAVQKFSATEDFQSVEIKRNEQLETPEIRKFDYMVLLDDSRPHLPEISEYRTQISGPAMPVGSIADGAPVLALAFHPDFRDDFDWTCEGLGEWSNQPAWIVHFEQRSDRPTSRLRAIELSTTEYPLALKGLAWISRSGGQVVHLESDLVKPIARVDLKREHFSVDYMPVAFRTHNVRLWLPQNVNVYLQYQGHFLHHYHHYSNFTLFWTGSTEKSGKPKEPKPQD